MRRVSIEASHGYDVWIGEGFLAQVGTILKKQMGSAPQKIALVSDHTVAAFYGDTVQGSFQQAGFQVARFSFPAGEGSKQMETLGALLEFLARSQYTRGDLIVALGGGVTGDLAGFAAAVYLRGIRYVQIPTTLLAAVDSSVGGKTAVNLAAGKNLVGAFHQPELVLCDCDTFHTLRREVLMEGVAECIKYGVIADSKLFKRFSAEDAEGNWPDIVERCVQIKGEIVAQDEFDVGLRQLLNFGHTVGHAVERCSDFAVTHGNAVAIGMVAEARAAEGLQLCDKPCAQTICEVLARYELPTQTPCDPSELLKAMLSDKKRTGGQITVIVPKTIGRCVLHTMPVEALSLYIEAGMGEAP